MEKALGNDEKIITASELDNKNIVRKSIVASQNIQKGEFFSKDNITVKRPGTGISPMKWNEVLGKQALKSYKQDEML